MTWNWQCPDWPNFKWERARISVAEEQFLLGAGVVIGTVKHLGEDEHKQLIVELMSAEAVTKSAIEGEVLNRASVQSSIMRQLGLESPDKRRVEPAEQGIAEMMVDLYRSFSKPLSDRMLFAWHVMLTSGRKDLDRLYFDAAALAPLRSPVVEKDAREKSLQNAELISKARPGREEAFPRLFPAESSTTM